MPIISSADAAAHALPNKYFKSNSKVMQKKRTLAHYQSSFFVRMVGLEPTRGHPRKILSLVRLPFRHIRMCEMFASQQSISYHPPSILSIPFLNFFQEIFLSQIALFTLHFLTTICHLSFGVCIFTFLHCRYCLFYIVLLQTIDISQCFFYNRIIIYGCTAKMKLEETHALYTERI